MKRVDRARLRGKPLDYDCYKAQVSHYEFGEDDKRCYCYGLQDKKSNEILDKCKECKAYVGNVANLKETKLKDLTLENVNKICGYCKKHQGELSSIYCPFSALPFIRCNPLKEEALQPILNEEIDKEIEDLL